MKNYFSLFATFCMSFFFTPANAQVTAGQDLTKPGTHILFDVRPCEPVLWTNDSNEFITYFEWRDDVHIFAFLNDKPNNFPEFPSFKLIVWTEFFFALRTSENHNYYFTVDSEKEDLLRLTTEPSFPTTKNFEGVGVVHHTWKKRKDGKPSVDQLKSAKSIYDVI